MTFLFESQPRSWFRRTQSITIALLLTLSAAALLVSPQPAHAASGIVQQNNGGCASGTCPGVTTSVSFSSGVTLGDIIVVGIADVAGSNDHTLSSVTDSQLFSYTAGASVCNGVVACAYVYYASATASGADTVSASFTAGTATGFAVDVYIYEVSGVTTLGLATATGSGGPSTGSVAISTSSTAAFSSSAFLLGAMVSGSSSNPFSAGSGFTASSQNSGSLSGWAEYSVSGVASPTNFPATLTLGNDHWAEAGIALDPSPVSVPEFPFQLALPLLFVVGVAIYLTVRRGVHLGPTTTAR